jgi:sugar phosphate isomerase/epimerase
MSVSFSVFTKPWPDLSASELGAFVNGMGFDGIELPVRAGYPAAPETVAQSLPAAAKQLADEGIRITSVAGSTDEVTMAACAEAGVPVIRICAAIGPEGYLASVERFQREFDDMLPLLDRYGVTVGVQNHSGGFVSHALGLHHLMERYDPRHVGAVWCPGHNAIAGEFPDTAIDLVWSHLCQVKFKNVYWEPKNGPEAEDVLWRPLWTSGRQGLASWPWVAEELKKRSFAGVICLDAEYDDVAMTDRLIRADIEFAHTLFSA